MINDLIEIFSFARFSNKHGLWFSLRLLFFSILFAVIVTLIVIYYNKKRKHN